MKLNRRDLKKIQYDYNKTCSWLLRADYRDYLKALRKFLNFLKENSIIYEYIVDCGHCELNIEKEFNTILNSRMNLNLNANFAIGENNNEEVKNIFAILEFIITKDERILLQFLRAYSHHAKSVRESLNEFNERFVMIIINHIESFLTKLGIDMGIDEKIVYNVTVNNGQVNLAIDSSIINANNSIGIDTGKIHIFTENVRRESNGLSDEDKNTLSDCLERIEIEASSPEPQKKLINIALAGLRSIKGPTEFSAAVVTLCDYARKFFNLF